jgi:hypothetical protein
MEPSFSFLHQEHTLPQGCPSSVDAVHATQASATAYSLPVVSLVDVAFSSVKGPPSTQNIHVSLLEEEEREDSDDMEDSLEETDDSELSTDSEDAEAAEETTEAEESPEADALESEVPLLISEEPEPFSDVEESVELAESAEFDVSEEAPNSDEAERW